MWWIVILATCAAGPRAARPSVPAPQVAPIPASPQAPASTMPPASLVGSETTPRLEAGCTFLLADHDAEEQPFTWELTLSVPDEAGLRWVQRVSLLPEGRMGLPAPSPVTTVHVLDVYQRFHDPRRSAEQRFQTWVQPRSVDFGKYPLVFSFIAPRPDRPRQIGEYELRIAVDPGSMDGTVGVDRPFVDCSNYTRGPGGPEASRVARSWRARAATSTRRCTASPAAERGVERRCPSVGSRQRQRRLLVQRPGLRRRMTRAAPPLAATPRWADRAARRARGPRRRLPA